MRRLLSLAVVVVLVAACGARTGGDLGGADSVPAVNHSAEPPTSDDQTQAEPTGGEMIASVSQRDLSPASNGKALNAVVRGSNQFAVDFFKTVVKKPTENVVIGNHSLATSLLMTMAGTGGKTTDAFGDLLGVAKVDRDLLHPAVNALDLILEGRRGKGLTLTTANKLFTQEGFALRPEFLDVVVASYGAPVRAVDFMNAPKEAVKVINEWVRQETEGFIKKLASRFSNNTKVVLANAMYLQAAWAVEFRRGEKPVAFHTRDGKVVPVEMMGHDEYLPLNEGRDFVAIELPYAGGNLGMVIVQPDDLGAFEKNLSAARLSTIADGLEESGIHLSMPMWSTETRLNALKPLQEMGLPSTYDFSGMIEGGEEGYWIDSVPHVARIEVDEEGTTAAAASGVAVAASHGPTIIIDRPYFYFIRDRGSGAILFMGHVVNPAQATGD